MSGPRRARGKRALHNPAFARMPNGALTSAQAEQQRQEGERAALRRARLHKIRELHRARQAQEVTS